MPGITATSFYIDCSPGSLGFPEYPDPVPSWAPPAKCPLSTMPSMADGGAAKNCRPHPEECRRIHRALEHKTLQSSVTFCPMQDRVFIHYNDGDTWERCCIAEDFFNGKMSAKCEALYEKPVPVTEPEEPPEPMPVTRKEKLVAAAKLAAKIGKLIALELAARMGFAGCGKSCKPDGFVEPSPLCLSTPRRKSFCVYMGRPGELFAKRPLVGEAGYKVVELILPAGPLFFSYCPPGEDRVQRRPGRRMSESFL
mmetsp:Transcript_47340/g.110725  ORF Transcript_47340/g.110725 Transcript_47340/m.110725 type:complete len:253 (-) Transcript_47340:68-826(-)